jgi:hypothetical protein
MEEIDAGIVLEHLSKERPIFHSEYDFQFAFAWKIKSMYPKTEVRVQQPMKRVRNSKKEKNEYIDLILRDERDIIGIELKYITA